VNGPAGGRLVRVCTADPRQTARTAAAAGEDGGAAARAAAGVGAEWGMVGRCRSTPG
jgi:hypothetical protein